MEERFFGKGNLMSSQYRLKVDGDIRMVLAVKKP